MTDETATTICETSHSKICRVDSSNYQNLLRGHYPPKIIAIKTLEIEFPCPDEIERFYKEYEVSQNVSHLGIRKAFSKGKRHNKHTLFMEWIDGITISDYGKMSVKEFLYLARQVVEALAELHIHRYVHNNVSTDNIIMNPDTHQVKLIGLGHCVMVDDDKVNDSFDPDRLDGDIQEHHNVVDCRFDLYGLGWVFYFMLTGKLSFEGDDEMKPLNMEEDCHSPVLCEVDPTIPTPLSNLVGKLMQDNPDDRYHLAEGLLHDLNMMISQVESNGEISSDFILAQKDCSGRFRVPQKLYGREKHVTTLLSAFDRVSKGTSEVIMVAGVSGTGKTSLVKNTYMPIMNKKGYFVSGKYDRLQKYEPYSAISQAFNNFCNLLLTESKEKYNYFRKKIQEAVGTEGKTLIDVIPGLQLIIGNQPDVPEVGDIETKNRFDDAICRFMKAICTAHHPMILFIDDLQWADSESLDLLSVLMTDNEIKYLLFVGAYRDNEVSEYHYMILEKMKENNVAIQTIETGNLSREKINELFMDSLNTTREETFSLTDLVHQKTHGNAFFVIEFCKSLVSENLLRFSRKELTWEWDVNKIEQKHVTENLVELIIKRIRKLSGKTQNILKLASCLGSQFERSTLQTITEEKNVEEALHIALNEDVIVNTGENNKFRFAHDKIQQALYSMIPEEDRNAIHLQIGRRLKQKFSDNDPTQKALSSVKETNCMSKRKLDEMLFVVVNQFNSGLDMITCEHERNDVSILNLHASKRARLSSAFKAASGCLAKGIELLGSNHWKKDYELSLELYANAAEMDYLNGNFDHMNEMLDEVFTNATSILDKVNAFSIQIKAFRAQKKLNEALEISLQLLKQLGETFPAQPNSFLILLELIQIKWLLWNKSKDAIASMPAAADGRAIAAMRIMAELFRVVIMVQPKLAVLIFFRVIELTMKYGITKWSVFGFGVYGTENCAHLDNEKKGYHFGQLSLDLLDRFPDKDSRCLIYTLVYAGINHFNESIHLSIKPLQDAFQLGKQVGEIELAFLAAWRYCSHLFLSGHCLQKVEREMKKIYQQMKAYKQEHLLNLHAPYWQTVLNFLGCGQSEDPTSLTGEAFDEDSIQENELARFLIHFNRMVLAYFFNKYELAAKEAEEIKREYDKRPIYENSNYWFYYGLISLALAREIKDDGKWIEIARECMAKIKRLAKNAPDNFLNKVHLLEAEYGFWKGYQSQAMRDLEKSIELAENQKFMHEVALAYERAGIFYIEAEQEELGFDFLSRAYQEYREWGSVAKLDQLKKLYGNRINVKIKDDLMSED